MNEIEFIRNSFADSVAKLVNANAEFESNLKWLVDRKAKFILSKISNKSFLAGELIKDDSHSGKNAAIDKESKMEVVAIKASIPSYIYINTIKREGKCYDKGIAQISIGFMQNPDKILKSNLKLTDKERYVLNRMKSIYDWKEPFMNDIDTLNDYNRDLYLLKHSISIFYNPEWSFTLEHLLQDDFVMRTLRCGDVRLWPY